MDGSKFDDLARALGQGTSRRKLLRGLAGGLAGILPGGALARRGIVGEGRGIVICHATGNPNAPYQSMTIQQAEFNLHARHGDYLRVECCADGDCPNSYGGCGQGVCQNGYCVQLPTTAGAPCDAGLACSASAVCDGAFACIGSPVVCAETDNPCTTAVCSESGGGCQEVPVSNGTTCGASDACVDRVCASGACVAAPKTSCTGNCVVCGNACVDLNSDPNNCQSCGHVCDTGSECTQATCRNGICGATPSNGGMPCGTSDACDDFFCSSGSCVRVPSTTCIGNCHACGDACVDLNSDPNNCQTCGHVCTSESACMAATCNLGTCGSTPGNEGHTCPTTNGDTGFCIGGSCINTCPMGTTCLFDQGGYQGVEGLCANGVCTCKPIGVAGLCDCSRFDSVAGCCSMGCHCNTGTCS